ncbi:hypothetical protein ACO0RG_003907 [Hanseniaspora osmophila]
MATPTKLRFDNSQQSELTLSPSIEKDVWRLTPVKYSRGNLKQSPFQTSSVNSSISASSANQFEETNLQTTNTGHFNSHGNSSNISNGSNQHKHTDSILSFDNSVENQPFPLPEAQKSFLQEPVTNTKYSKTSLRFTKELENLMQDLNTIYNDIGYSSKEIVQKETVVFSQLSDTIRSFSTTAQSEKSVIAHDNDRILKMLRLVLKRLGDPRGTSTIQDLYSRNMIVLSNQDLSPSKREMSLLNKRKVLLQGSQYIFKKFQRVMGKYLELCEKHSSICELLDIKQDKPEKIPLYVMNAIDCEKLKTVLDDQDQLFQFFLQNFDAFESLPNELLNKTDFTEKGFHNLKNKISNLNTQYTEKLAQLKEILEHLKYLIEYLCLEVPSDLYNLIDDKELFKNEETIMKYLQDFPESTKTVIPSTMIPLLLRIMEALDILKTTREEDKNKMHEQCVQLWSKLKVDQEEISNFMNYQLAKYGSSLPAEMIHNYKMEIEKLIELRKQSISQLIQENWSKINELWDKMGYPAIDREDFTNYYELNDGRNISGDPDQNSELDEILLSRCEKEVSILEERYKLYEPLLKLLEVFERYMQDKAELERSSKDSSRLLSRNSHKILLNEERLRKKISKNFPTIVKSLLIKLTGFEDQFNRPFYDASGNPYKNRVLEAEQDLRPKHIRSRIDNGAPSSTVTKRSPLKNPNRVEKPQVSKKILANSKPVAKKTADKFVQNNLIAKRNVSASSSNSSGSSSTTSTTASYRSVMSSTRPIGSPVESVHNSLSPIALSKLNSPNQQSSQLRAPQRYDHLTHRLGSASKNQNLGFEKENGPYVEQQHQHVYSKVGSPTKVVSVQQRNIVSMSPSVERNLATKFNSEHSVKENFTKYRENMAESDEKASNENIDESKLEGDNEDEMNDSNFSIWKHEQLAKINKCETTSPENGGYVG